MPNKNGEQLVAAITTKAMALGADLAGVVSVADLRHSPSHVLGEQLPDFEYRGYERVEGRRSGAVVWPEGARSALVIAISHPPAKPELDWLVVDDAGRNTPGNTLLIKTSAKLAVFIENVHGIRCFKSAYHIVNGAVYMKDAAVLAGLGCIGKNNMLITPQYGPHQRLRVLLMAAELPTSGPIDYHPCLDCPMPCREACPQTAFVEKIYSREKYRLDELPGIEGVYSRLRCNRQMEIDNVECEAISIAGQAQPGGLVKYCRRCELACPVGSP